MAGKVVPVSDREVLAVSVLCGVQMGTAIGCAINLAFDMSPRRVDLMVLFAVTWIGALIANHTAMTLRGRK